MEPDPWERKQHHVSHGGYESSGSQRLNRGFERAAE